MGLQVKETLPKPVAHSGTGSGLYSKSLPAFEDSGIDTIGWFIWVTVLGSMLGPQAIWCHMV